MNKKLLLLVLILLFVFSQKSYASDPKSTTEINKMYYNLSQSNLNKFSCEVSSNLLEQLKKRIYSYLNDNDQNELESVKLYFSYQGNNHTFNVPHYPELRDAQMRQEMSQAINEVKQTVISFFSFWGSLVSDPIFNENEECDFIENENGFITNYKQEDSNIDLVFDQDYVLQKITCRSKKISFIIIPKYTSTDKGLLITDINFRLKNDSLRELIKIEYQELKGVYLPKNVIIKTRMKTNTLQDEQKDTLKFFNYKVKLLKAEKP